MKAIRRDGRCERVRCAVISIREYTSPPVVRQALHPPELRELPAGRWVVEAVEEAAPAISPEEEACIEAALESYRQGRVVDAKRAREVIDTLHCGSLMCGRRFLRGHSLGLPRS